MKVTFRNNGKNEEKTYKTMRGVNNFINKKVQDYDLTLVEKKFQKTEIEVWVYKGGAGWEVTFHINKK